MVQSKMLSIQQLIQILDRLTFLFRICSSFFFKTNVLAQLSLMKTAPMKFPTTGSQKILQFLCHLMIVCTFIQQWNVEQPGPLNKILRFKDKNLLILAKKSFSGKFLQIKKCLTFALEKLTIFTKHFILDALEKVSNTPPTFFCGQDFEYVSLNKYLLQKRSVLVLSHHTELYKFQTFNKKYQLLKNNDSKNKNHYYCNYILISMNCINVKASALSYLIVNTFLKALPPIHAWSRLRVMLSINEADLKFQKKRSNFLATSH